MDRQPAKRSSLFLIELIIAILFFSLAATICVRIFVKSHTLEKNSIDLNHAVTAAVSVAEIFRSQEDSYIMLQQQFPDGELTENSYGFFYDKNWNLCNSSNAEYTVTLHTEESDTFLLGTVTITRRNESLYQLHLKKTLGKEEL